MKTWKSGKPNPQPQPRKSMGQIEEPLQRRTSVSQIEDWGEEKSTTQKLPEATEPVRQGIEPEKQNTEKLPSGPQQHVDAQPTEQLLVKRRSSKIPPTDLPPLPQVPLKIPLVDQQNQMWEPSAISRKRGPILPGLVSREPAGTLYSLEKAKITTPLKVDPEKIVVIADFNGKEQVLKIGVGTGDVVKANVLSSQWIRRLKLKGITAPETTLVPVTERGLDNVLKGLPPIKSADLREALSKVFSAPDQSVGGMVSGRATGADVGDLLDASTYAALRVYTNPPQTEAEARDAYVKMLEKTPRISPLGNPLPAARKSPFGGATGWGDELSDQPPAQGGADFQAWLTEHDTLVNELDTTSSASRGIAKYSLQVHLAKLGAPLAQKAVASKADIIENQSPKFQKWLKSSDGNDAVIRQICVDLIIGQEDRLVSSFHGGNFKFDGKQFIDTDNGSKVGNDLLRKPPDEYATWIAGVVSSTRVTGLSEALAAKITSSELGPLLGQVKPDRVKKLLKEVTKQFSTVATSNRTEEGAQAILDRVGKIQALLPP